MTGVATSSVFQGAEGLALALSLALLGPWRWRSLTLLYALQTAVVAVAALAQGLDAVAVIALVEAGFLAWAAQTQAPPPPLVGGGWGEVLLSVPTARLAGAALLAALATATPAGGIGLAIILLGLLVLCGEPPQRQALGAVALQNGLVLAAIVSGLSGWHVAPVAAPVLPVAAFTGLWLGRAQRRAAGTQPPPAAGQIEAALCALALLCTCALPWLLGRYPPLWSIDARAAQVVLSIGALSTAASWSNRHAAPVPGSRLAILAGTVFAVLSVAPLVSWLGMALAALSAAALALPRRAEAWRRLMLGVAGLSLALFGAVALHARPSVPAAGLLMLGYGMIALLAPELAIAAAALVLRVPGGAANHVLLAAGLAALLIAACGLARRGARHDPMALVDLAQGGVAVFAFGLGTPVSNLAGLLQLTLLALTRCATLLTKPAGLDRAAALAGLAGAPPFGVFASLAMILEATAAQAAWLLLPLGAGLAVVAWKLLSRLPAERRLLPSPAWLPLALALLCGLAMPGPLLTWFRLAAR